MPHRVLIVDDDLDIRTDLAALLEDEGFQVDTANDGLQALDYLQSAVPPCLILLDLMMPKLDGWQLRLEMLKNAALAAIPVVLFSGVGNIEQEAEALGAAAYVAKPFKLTMLLDVINNYC